MTRVLSEVLQANEVHARDFAERADLSASPRRRFAMLTCMDARLDPALFAGAREGDAHIIRNAGGRASNDAIRSLIVSHKLLGTNEWFVVHHTDCGLEFISEEKIRDLLAGSLGTAVRTAEGYVNVDDGPGSHEADYIDWLTIRSQPASVIADVRRIRAHPLVPKSIPIYGYIYDVKTGRLIEVPEAMEAGRSG